MNGAVALCSLLSEAAVCLPAAAPQVHLCTKLKLSSTCQDISSLRINVA